MEVGGLILKKNIIIKICICILLVSVISAGVLHILLRYNKDTATHANSELGALYMSEMMYQLQEHFQTIVELKNEEAVHIVEHAILNQDIDYKIELREAANTMNFEYVALYDKDGNCDVILGEMAWYRNLDGFMEEVKAGNKLVTTGYLTSTGGKYLVFGVPANFDMSNGQTSEVVLAGFNVEQLYQYINLDQMNELGSNVYIDIILTNGAYVLKTDGVDETSFFDLLNDFGSFAGTDVATGIDEIEKAMAGGNSFSCMVIVDGEVQHVYGASAVTTSDWYFVLYMSQGVADNIINNQNQVINRAYVIAGAVILWLLIGTFLFYMHMSAQQIKEIEKARKEAEVANQAKSTFLSNMSHDIRTPMNAILGFTTIIEECIVAKEYDRATESLNKIKHSSEYLSNLISDVLDMSKIESGMLTLALESTSLKKLINTVIDVARVYTQANEQIFNVDIHDILHNGIKCDETRLNQILINLFSNAIKFTPKKGTINFEVWQEESRKGNDYIKTCFVVEDNGIGMSEEFITNMFESFAREDSKVRKIEGTGLGLTITKSLLDMMGGTIETTSKEGEGSRFLISLDFLKVDYVEYDMDVEYTFDDIKGMKILMAEDNDFNYDIAEILFSNNGFIIERAENGQVVVDKYCNNPSHWDIILMDLRMPIFNGYEATEKIREFEQAYSDNIHIPIFALSADVFAEDIEHCLKVGMEGHISKPINMKELMNTLQKYMSSRQ